AKEAEAEAQGSEGPAKLDREGAGPGPEEDALRQTLQRTAGLCRSANAALGERHRGDFVFDPGDSLANTADSLGEALRANEDALQRVRAGILEELQARGLSAEGGPDGRLQETEGEGDLESLLAECDAIQVVASRWRGLETPPVGWRKLAPDELGK
ncbi:unnamed protein product, partial [Prorocentrum cordatum]